MRFRCPEVGVSNESPTIPWQSGITSSIIDEQIYNCVPARCTGIYRTLGSATPGAGIHEKSLNYDNGYDIMLSNEAIKGWRAVDDIDGRDALLSPFPCYTWHTDRNTIAYPYIYIKHGYDSRIRV